MWLQTKRTNSSTKDNKADMKFRNLEIYTFNFRLLWTNDLGFAASLSFEFTLKNEKLLCKFTYPDKCK